MSITDEQPPVAWACWIDGVEQDPKYMQLCGYEPFAYPQRRPLVFGDVERPPINADLVARYADLQAENTRLLAEIARLVQSCDAWERGYDDLAATSKTVIEELRSEIARLNESLALARVLVAEKGKS